MPLSLDAYLGIHPEALKLQSRRMEVIANNLANVDTPNYKARDIDFQAALAAATGGGYGPSPVALAMTDPLDIAASAMEESSPDLKYRTPLAPSLDGNTVNSELEQAAFAEAGVRYQATLTFLTTSLHNLMTAITGQ